MRTQGSSEGQGIEDWQATSAAFYRRCMHLTIPLERLAVVVMPSEQQKVDQVEEVNWELRSEVSLAGTPKHEIHWARAAMQVLEEVSWTG